MFNGVGSNAAARATWALLALVDPRRGCVVPIPLSQSLAVIPEHMIGKP